MAIKIEFFLELVVGLGTLKITSISFTDFFPYFVNIRIRMFEYGPPQLSSLLRH